MEKVFARGVYFDRRTGAPDFVIGNLSFKVAEAIVFLQENVNEKGYVNCDIKISKDGKRYVELNTYKKEDARATNSEPTIEYPSDINPDDIPF